MTHAIDDTDTTRLGQAVAPLVAAHPGQAGIHALAHPHDAFAARALLADAAERAIDAQYYMWHGDTTGILLFEKLWRAAERGVRVRLLVDDNNTAGLDETLAALDSQPNLEVRLYNPLSHRRVRALSYVLAPRRMNRRMHNKSFTVDNQAAWSAAATWGTSTSAPARGWSSRTSMSWAWARSFATSPPSSIDTGTARRPHRRRGSSRRPAPRMSAASSRTSRRSGRTRRPRSTCVLCGRRPSSRGSWKAGSPWSGRKPESCATTRPRRWIRSVETPSSCSRRCWS